MATDYRLTTETGWYCGLTHQVTLGGEKTCDTYAGDDHEGCGWRLVVAAVKDAALGVTTNE